MSAREVVQRLIASALDSGPKGKDDQTGYGLIRPFRALTDAPPQNTPNPVFDAYAQWAAGKGRQQGQAAPEGGESGQQSSAGFVPLIVGIAVLVVAIIVVLLVVRGRNRRRLQAAGAGQYCGPGAPPPYGMYQPQGGRPPAPGAQQQ